MKLNRFAQLLAGLSLGSLGAGVWLAPAVFTALSGGNESWWSPALLLDSLLNVLIAGGYSLALASAVLVLPLFWQRHQRVWFAVLLAITLVLVFTQDSGLYARLVFEGLMFSTPPVAAGPPTSVRFAVYTAVSGAPSAFLALAVLGCGFIGAGGGAARRHTSIIADEPSADESSLEIYIESLSAPTAD